MEEKIALNQSEQRDAPAETELTTTIEHACVNPHESCFHWRLPLGRIGQELILHPGEKKTITNKDVFEFYAPYSYIKAVPDLAHPLKYKVELTQRPGFSQPTKGYDLRIVINGENMVETFRFGNGESVATPYGIPVTIYDFEPGCFEATIYKIEVKLPEQFVVRDPSFPGGRRIEKLHATSCLYYKRPKDELFKIDELRAKKILNPLTS